MKRFLILLSLALLSGCGGGGGGGGESTPSTAATGTSFWAYDLTRDTYYTVNATEVAEGAYCHIYLEQGQSVSQADIDAIQNEFDNIIHPKLVEGFGSEPNPGIDSDPKMFILLLKVRDGFNSVTSTSYVAGYFDPANEYADSNSNRKEIIYMNINPDIGIDPSGTDFFSTVAHEFQHLIHWEQKRHQRNVSDDAWLDEAMSTVARTYCGYGPDYDLLYVYEMAPTDSLTIWGNALQDYGVVYMWGQYFKDRVGSDIFRRMLQNSQAGIASVNSALAAAGSAKTFTDTFRDWAVANYYGNGTTVTAPQNNPEWSYISINTWPGIYGGMYLPGLFRVSNATSLASLGPWSLGFYSYTPTSSSAHSVTWTPVNAAEKAAFVDAGGATLTFGMTSGTQYSFTTKAYLTIQNPTGNSGSGASVVYSDLAGVASEWGSREGGGSDSDSLPMRPSQVMAAANKNPLAGNLKTITGRPQRVSITTFLRERENEIRAMGKRPPF